MTKKDFAAAAASACEELLAEKVIEVATPGGSKRDSLRLRLGQRSVIATRRPKSIRSHLEVNVLRALHDNGAPVPRILAYDGVWLIQEDMGDRRLSQVLVHANESENEIWLSRALDGLAATHRAGRAAGMEKKVATLGETTGWRRELVGMPARLSRHLDLPAPSLPERELIELIRIRDPWLIKWDARPGNATACEDGTVAWFDWEHCGARNRLDDVAWLLGDEFIGDWPESEKLLLARCLPDFADGVGADEAMAYVSAFGVFHMCVRLGLIVDYKKDGPWWDLDKCVARDQAGVTLESAQGLCARASRWASRSPLVKTLVPWFDSVSRRFQEL